MDSPVNDMALHPPPVIARTRLPVADSRSHGELVFRSRRARQCGPVPVVDSHRDVVFAPCRAGEVTREVEGDYAGR